jgi:hypothetical protein
MLVQVIDPFDNPVLERAANRDIVEKRQVLHVLAETDSARVRAHWNPELRSEKKDRDRLVHASDSAGIELADIDRLRLKQLLEDDAVLNVLACCNTNRLYLTPDSRMTENIVRARRLLYPPRVVTSKDPHG